MNAKVCPQCGTRYEGEQRFCSLDGATLIREQAGESLTGVVLADRYLILQKLGEGGMGEVYEAQHVRMKRRVAVKVIRKALTSDPAAIGRFHREAENASQISHPNVAAVYDFGEAEGLFYLAMEYVAGHSLTRVLEREGPLNHIRTADIVSQIAEALDAAHSLGILHRDLKPDNVMLGLTRVGTDQVKLLDFGIARVMGSERETQNLTRTGLVVGTPEWMSPEQISGDMLDARADVYALGLIAFRTLTGEGAFGGGSSQEILLAKMTKPPRRLGDVRADVPWPPELQATIDHVLAVDPSNRYPSAPAFAREFYYGTSQLPASADAADYQARLSERAVTPSRGVGTTDMTPSGPISGFGSRIPTPPPTRATEEVTAPVPIAALAQAGAAAVAASNQTPTAEIPLVTVATSAVTPPETGTATVSTMGGESVATFGGAAGPHAAARRRAPWRAVGAVTAIAAIAAVVVLVRGRSGAGTPAARTTTAPNVISQPVTDTLHADTAAKVAATPDTTTHAAPISAPAAPTAIGQDSVRKLANSVFHVVGSAGQGAGFYADPPGVVLTSASFLEPTDSTASVFLDGSTRLIARVLGLDATSGVAALLISPKLCPKCAPLRAGGDTVAVGDSVFAIGAPSLGRDRGIATGAVSTAEPKGRVRTSLKVAASQVGGPVLLARTGGLLGLASKTGGGTVASLASAKAFLTRVTKDLDTKKPVEELPPTWPSRPMPDADLRAGRSRTDAQIDSLRLFKDDFAVLIMTPQVMAWRKQQAETIQKTATPTSNNFCHPGERCDPIENWAAWNDYVAERRAVVVIQVSPNRAPPPQFGHPLTKLAFRGRKFGSLELLRDNQPVPPIEAARIHAVVNPGDYTPAEQQYYSGIYVFRPSDLIGAQKLELHILEDSPRPRGPSVVLLTKDQMAIIASDVGKYAPPR